MEGTGKYSEVSPNSIALKNMLSLQGREIRAASKSYGLSSLDILTLCVTST